MWAGMSTFVILDEKLSPIFCWKSSSIVIVIAAFWPPHCSLVDVVDLILQTDEKYTTEHESNTMSNCMRICS